MADQSRSASSVHRGLTYPSESGNKMPYSNQTADIRHPSFFADRSGKCEQIRKLCFLLAEALKDGQLPPFPKPSLHCTQ